MTFFPLILYEGKTVFTDKAPSFLQHLVLPVFTSRFVNGPWGYYLSQWYETTDFVFWIHYFIVKEGEKFHTTSEDSIFTHHHLIKGQLSTEINNGITFHLSEELSHFFYIPKEVQHFSYFGKEPVISIQFDWNQSFLQSNAAQYSTIALLLEQAATHPNRISFTPPAYHSRIDNQSWNELIENLHQTTNPSLLLQEKGREFLRKFCESIEQQPTLLLRDSRFNIHPSDEQAAHKARLIIESDLSVHYSLLEISKKVNINDCTLKRVFKHLYKTTIYQYLKAARLQFAYQELLKTDKSINDIAFEVGYFKASHFSKLFKKKFKIEPRELRNRMK